MSETKYYFTKKDLAAAMGRTARFVRFMELGGFILPASMDDAVHFIRENPFPSRFYKRKPQKSGKF
jgi:hypothetical protein